MNHRGIASSAFAQEGFRALVVAAGILLGPSGAFSDDWPGLSPRPQDILGSLSCTSVACHRRIEPRNLAGALSQQEYLHWLGGQPTYASGLRHYDPRARIEKNFADPHAVAGRRILEPRFQDVLRRASNLPDGQPNPQVYAKCARCHDPCSSPHAPHEYDRAALPGDGLRNVISTAGIGCESCHGGARNWITVHYQQDFNRKALAELGMIDTKNVLVRARLCASCHVGSADQDMNHDMIAAGHPPLRFELASHQSLIEHKHWDDAPRRLSEPNYEVQLWAAGRIADTEAALALLEGRATRAVRQESAWPEFAEANCFTCHQQLRPVAPVRADAERLSVRNWQTWNVAFASPLVAMPPLGANELPPPTPSFEQLMVHLNAKMARSSTSPAEIALLATGARAALQRQVRISQAGEIVGLSGSPLEVDEVLPMIAVAPKSEATWELLCQQLGGLLAAERAVRDRAAREGALGEISSEQEAERAAACEKVRQRARQVANSLRFSSDQFEWPVIFGRSDQVDGRESSMEQVAAEIRSLAGELARIRSGTEH